MHMPPGGVRSLLPDGFRGRMRETLDTIEQVMKDVDKALFQNSVYKTRSIGLGYIDPSMVDRWGYHGA